MKPLFSIVVAILVLAATAHAEATEESKELTKGKEPVAEAEETDPQAREERCTTCAKGTNHLTKNVLEALLASPNAEVHTQESFEECSSEKGCAGIKLKDGKVVQKFGSLDDFNAAAASHGSGSEFQFQAAKILEGSLPNGGPYWWMNQNSPFKNTGAAAGGGNGHSEKFSKFQSSSFSTSSNGGAGGVDLAANPFLNGDFSKLSGGFTSAGGNFAAGQGFESSSSGSSQGAGFAAGQGNGFAAGQGAGFGNGFASGQGGAFGSGSQNAFASNSQSSQSFGQNGFANGAQGTTGQAAIGGTGLGGGQGNFNSYNSASKFASTGFTGSSPAPFASSGANVNLIQNSQKSDYDFEQQQQTQQNIDEIFQSTGNVQAHESTSGDIQQTCAGQGYICVHKAQCNNGVVNTNGGSLLQANTQKQYCNTRTEVCCRLETSSLAGAANSQGTLGIGSATFTGSSNQGSGLFSQTGSGTSQSGFGTTGFGAGAGQNTQSTNAFNSVNRETSSTGFGANTNQFNTGASQFGSSFGQSSNTNKFAGSGFGSTLAPPPVRINPNSFNNEVFKSTSSFSETDTFSSGSENANVFRPGAVGTGLKPGIPYLPPDTSTGASNVVSTAFVTTPRPFTTPRPPPRPFTTPRPVTYLPPVSSTAAPTYLPPVEPLDGSESRPSYVDGGVILDEFLPGPTRPPVPINREIPAGCAAALKCTPIEFCTAEGVMSNTTVVLTRDQEAYRVPLTDCKDIETGRIGKCCRDPYYTDPWPVNQLGKWVPDVFGGNDGKYIPDSRGSPNIQRPVVTARPPVTGGVILNSFRNTPKPILPQGPNQVTPGPTITPGFVKTQYNQNTVTQTGRGQYEQGGRGQYEQGGRGQYGSQGQFGQGSSFSQTFGQGQTGQVGVGQTVTQESGSFGQAGRGQYEVVGQGIQANRGTGFQVTQGTGQVVRQGTGIGLTRGQGFGVSQGGGAITTQGGGQTVSQGSGQTVTQGFGTGVRQGSGFGVSQGSGFGVQQGGGVGVSQGAGFGVSQGSGQSVLTGQGVGVRQGQGFQVTQGGGQFGQFGTGQGTRVGQGFGVTQGGGAVVSRGQGTAVTQGGGFGVQQGGGFGVRQGQGFGVSQGTGTGFGFGQGQALLQGQRQALVQGQGEESTQESVHRVFLTKYTGSGQCGLLNPQKPYGNRRDLEVDFAEIPWQAMVLLQTNKSLLCGGVITRPDVVITTASCVEGLQAKNVLIKGGEWKLGIDEEPLPFQIVQVKTILRHPFYQVGSLKNDVAILVLTEDLRLAKNIWPICLPSSQDNLDAFYNGAGECIVTGWGKNVLQAHLLGSIMHGMNVSLINPGECQNKLQQDYPHLLDNYEQDSCVCGQPTNPANNICKVDTGSALACTTGDGSYVLRGIYSWESGCQVGNQLAAFYKFDLEWYEWAIGLIESVRFAKYTTVTVTKNKVISQVTGSTYTSGVKGFGVQGQGQAIKQGFGVQGQTGSGATIKQGFGIQQQTGSGTGVKQGFGVKGVQGQGAAIKQGFGVTGQSGEFGQISTTKFSGESGENANVNFGSELNGPLSKTFSATYTEKKFFQTEPKFVTYTTKPEIVTFTTKPEYYTFTTKPKIVTYTTKPEIVTYTTKPEIVTYTTKPEIFTYTTKPKIVTYTTKPQFITYETAGTINNPKYVSPSLSFSEVVGAHKHTAACKCLDKNAK